MAFRKTRARTMVKDTTTLTTAYTGFVTDPIVLQPAGAGGMRGRVVGFVLDTVKGTTTSFEFVLEVGDEDAVAATAAHWSKLCKASGAIDERTIAVNTLAATDYITVFSDVDLSVFPQVRLRAKVTGTADATLKAYALVGGEI